MNADEFFFHAKACLDSDAQWVCGTHINFSRYHPGEGTRITQLWAVSYEAEARVELGWVKWFGRWRKYSFFPNPEMVFEEVCLREIAHFCEILTLVHKAKKKAAKA